MRTASATSCSMPCPPTSPPAACGTASRSWSTASVRRTRATFADVRARRAAPVRRQLRRAVLGDQPRLGAGGAAPGGRRAPSRSSRRERRGATRPAATAPAPHRLDERPRARAGARGRAARNARDGGRAARRPRAPGPASGSPPPAGRCWRRSCCARCRRYWRWPARSRSPTSPARTRASSGPTTSSSTAGRSPGSSPRVGRRRAGRCSGSASTSRCARRTCRRSSRRAPPASASSRPRSSRRSRPC